MNKFKVGDKVYFPFRDTKVHTLQRYIPVGASFHKLQIVYENGVTENFIPDGRRYDAYPATALVHATPENHAMLEALYGIEFEVPPPKSTPKQIIKAMLARGDKYVLCLVADNLQQIAEGNGVPTAVTAVEEGSVFCFHTESYCWKYAIPIDQQGNEIQELPQ